MSSRNGPRASGTDGSDFTHREKVASHYRDSVKWKSKLKLNLSLHLLCVSLVATWSILGLFKFVKFKVADWHIAWLCSAVPVLLGMSSLPKNKLGQMYAFVIGYIILGFGSLIYGGTKYSKTFVEHVYQKSPQMLDVRGFSLNLAILGLVLQMQIMALYYAIRLIGAWQSKGEKKTS